MQSNKIAIISAIPDEIDVFREILKGSTTWDDKNVQLVVSGVGKVQAAAATQKVISEFKPDLLFLTGFAGSLNNKMAIGDIGIVSSAIDAEMDGRAFDSSLRLGEVPFKNERVYHTNKTLVDLALKSPLNINKFDSYIASLSVFMDEEKKNEFIRTTAPLLIDESGKAPDLVDMESIGFLTAANANDIPCLIVKSVANNIQGDSSKEYGDSIFNERTRNYVDIVGYILTNLSKTMQ